MSISYRLDGYDDVPFAVFRRLRTAISSLALVCLGLSAPANPQAAPANASKEKRAVIRLEPGTPIEKELAGGATDTDEIQVGTGQFLHVVVDQKGIDVALTLYGPNGKQIATMDSPNGTYGPEKISAIAVTVGLFRLVIAPRDKHAPNGKYTLEIRQIHSPTEVDLGSRSRSQKRWNPILPSQDFEQFVDVVQVVEY
jgi:hypothetical protein